MKLVVRTLKWSRAFVNVSYRTFYIKKIEMQLFNIYSFLLTTACYGSYGKDCTENCTTGFFGFGCRSQCYCEANQLCDSKIGCVNTCLNGMHIFEIYYFQ